ncbi:MAG: hypothetical protein RSB96_04415 [Oscillospiraceae bacterium]
MQHRFFPVIQQTLKAMIGVVSTISTHCFFVKSHYEHREVEVVMPFGIHTFPQKEDDVLMIEVEGRTFCLGAIHKQEVCAQNKVSICNEKGYLHIHENGEVEINGLRIATDGTIKEKGALS